MTKDAEEAGLDPPEIDKETLVVPVPNSEIYKLLKLRLQENDCRNRGYVLDGFPRNHEDCEWVFLQWKKGQKENPEDEEDLEEPEHVPFDDDGKPVKKEFPLDKYEPNPLIFPQSTILLQQEDKFLIDRVKDLDEEIVEGTHYNMKDMKRRLLKYRTDNESEVAEPSVSDFFKTHNIPVFARDAA